ncbi:hypothetical protein AF280_00005, partial [Listeria monocytogenes]
SIVLYFVGKWLNGKHST